MVTVIYLLYRTLAVKQCGKFPHLKIAIEIMFAKVLPTKFLLYGVY